jgi:hypothetical protein
MAIEFEIDTNDGVLTFHFTSQPVLEDYQSSFPAALREAEAAGITRWLLVLEYSEPSSDEKIRAFNEFVAQEISRYVTKMAVVCPVQGHARVRDVLEPIINQGKEVGMFQMTEEAMTWLLRQPPETTGEYAG